MVRLIAVVFALVLVASSQMAHAQLGALSRVAEAKSALSGALKGIQNANFRTLQRHSQRVA